MRKLIPFVFLIIAAVLAYFIFSKNLFSDNEGDFSSNVVIPIMEGESDGSLVNSDDFFEARESVAFINLNADEILVSTVELDIDSDGSDDQIVFVKSIASPTIIAIAATYNPQTTKYQREASFLTEISQSRTFAATSLDVLGKHKNSLVYQGLNDEGKMIMKILSVYRDKNSKIKTDVLGDFSAEGTIFIQQSQRSEGYELNGEKGESRLCTSGMNLKKNMLSHGQYGWRATKSPQKSWQKFRTELYRALRIFLTDFGTKPKTTGKCVICILTMRILK